ncbi:MAG: hypothetical protein ABNG98_01310 [Flavobacterium sp.]|jgi:hypothetical protein
MKNKIKSLFVGCLLIFGQFIAFSQENKVKIYQSKSEDGTCAIVFPNSPPLIIITSSSGCTEAKTMAIDDWTELSPESMVTVTIESPSEIRESPTKLTKRDAATGLATGKRQHKPMRVYKEVSMEKLGGDADGDGIEVYKFSWKVEEGVKFTGEQSSEERGSRTDSSSSSCCANGVCSVVVSVDKKHTKTGHVTLLK